jgi:hypothetical protein
MLEKRLVLAMFAMTFGLFAQTGVTGRPEIFIRPVDPSQSAQSGPAAATSKPEPPAKLHGRITNAATGAPIKRANIILMSAEPRPDATPYSTSSDAAGEFAMSEIVPGKYRLWAERTGYVRNEYGARGTNPMGAVISIAPGQEISKLEFRLQPHAVITGRVTDEDGEPLSHVQVQTMTYRFIQGKRQLVPSGSASTNDLGEYRIFGLPPGRFYLSATLRNSGMMFNAVDRTAGTRTPGPELGYAPTYYPGTTDPRSAVLIPVTSGKPVPSMDIRLARAATVRIRGRIVNASMNPAMPPMIMLAPRGSAFTMFDRNTSTARGPEGRFELRGIAPGAYYLIAQIFSNEQRQFARVPVDVGNTDVEGLEITLSPGKELAGSVRADGTDSVDLSTIRLFLEPKEFSPMGGGNSATVKADGSFLIRNVIADKYRVRVMGPQNQFYVKAVYLGQQEAKDGEIEIVPGVAPTVTVLVSAAGGQISGTVKGEKGPAQGVTVVLIPDVTKRHRQDLFKVAATDQYGKFSLTSIAPGDYQLFSWDAIEMGQWNDPDFLQQYETKGKSISIRENAKETADLEAIKNETTPETSSAR